MFAITINIPVKFNGRECQIDNEIHATCKLSQFNLGDRNETKCPQLLNNYIQSKIYYRQEKFYFLTDTFLFQ